MIFAIFNTATVVNKGIKVNYKELQSAEKVKWQRALSQVLRIRFQEEKRHGLSAFFLIPLLSPGGIYS